MFCWLQIQQLSQAGLTTPTVGLLVPLPMMTDSELPAELVPSTSSSLKLSKSPASSSRCLSVITIQAPLHLLQLSRCWVWREVNITHQIRQSQGPAPAAEPMSGKCACMVGNVLLISSWPVISISPKGGATHCVPGAPDCIIYKQSWMLTTASGLR